MPQLPRGLYDVGIQVLDATTEAAGSIIQNFYPRSLSETYQSDTASIDGGDQRLEDLVFNERYEMSLETAGLPLAALAAMEGTGTLGTAGSGSTLVTTLRKNVLTHVRPFFRLRAQQKDKNGGSTIFTFYKTTLNGSPTFNAAQGEYATPTLPLIAIPAAVVVGAVTGPPAYPAVAIGDLYRIQQEATYAALA